MRRTYLGTRVASLVVEGRVKAACDDSAHCIVLRQRLQGGHTIQPGQIMLIEGRDAVHVELICWPRYGREQAVHLLRAIVRIVLQNAAKAAP